MLNSALVCSLVFIIQSLMQVVYIIHFCFQIMISIFITWSFSAILTAAGAFDPGHRARTDNRLAVLDKVPWFRVPYPGMSAVTFLSPNSF